MKTKNNLFPGAIYKTAENELVKILTMGNTSVTMTIDKKGYTISTSFSGLHPVPLDHDILGMLGFGGECVQTGLMSYGYSPTTTMLSKWSFEVNYSLIHPVYNIGFGSIQYVHQLQQIYLALHQVLLELK
jgi:hypothetical protein